MTNYEFYGIIYKGINCTPIGFKHSFQNLNKIKLKTIFVHIMTIYRAYIYYHDMYKNELNQQNKGDETNEKFCIPKPFITTYTL